MNVGRLNKRVTIQERTTTENEYGEPISTWVDVASDIAAAVEPLQGRELFAAQQVQSEVTIRVRIRYRAGIKAAMRVLYGVRVLDIQSVIDPLEKHAELQLLCAEGVTNG